MASDIKRLLATVPKSVSNKVRVALINKDETMQSAIIKTLLPYLGIDLTDDEREALNLLTEAEIAEKELSECEANTQ